MFRFRQAWCLSHHQMDGFASDSAFDKLNQSTNTEAAMLDIWKEPGAEGSAGGEVTETGRDCVAWTFVADFLNC